MNKKLKQNLLIIVASLCVLPVSAQLSSNPYKFFGNITTGGQVEAGGGVPKYYTLWNQITCENESKWSSVEGSRGNFNWGGANNAFNYAKQHNFTYKFHALVWGAQYPSWLENLSAKERFSAMTNWFDHAKSQYNTLPMIDVVNEAVGMHQQGNPMMKKTLGGGGKTGYDWLIKAFEMAYERWPDAILIYNDYNSIRYDLDNYITLVQTLRDNGAPIDAYGNQSHELSDISLSELENALKKQQDALKMPMFSTELDIDIADDTQQLNQYKKVLPALWEKTYCAGVTLWGYILGRTWVTNSGLYRDGAERPAMAWIKEYMATDAAKNAVGPLPGTKKEASIYIRPASYKVANGDVLPIMVRARMATKTIQKVDLYVGSELIATMIEAPYLTEYTASSSGTKTLKAVVTTTDGSTYERYGRFQVLSGTTKREPYNEIVPELPGTVDPGEFDRGASGVSYSGVTTTVYNSRDKFATTATQTGAWMEYTVDVKEGGFYTLEAEVASTKDGGSFHLAEYTFDNLKFLTEFTDGPNTGSATEFQTVRCPITEYLTAGRHVLTLLVDNGGFYVKGMKFNHVPTFAMPGAVELKDMVRSEGVEIKTTSEGDVLTMDNTDWAEYLVDVTLTNGKYSYELTASSETGASVTMTLIDSDGKETSLGTVSVPSTSSLDTYQLKTGKIRNKLNEGKQTLRMTMKSGSCNIASLNFKNTESTGIDELESNETVITNETYNLS
ncbi:MAG: endo-1,4-beta-xylanase, partial [Bacteroidaceae bacterium]|nr:endo-1,4-beta-xylanase [Bacteroidaceae bacterium]